MAGVLRSTSEECFIEWDVATFVSQHHSVQVTSLEKLFCDIIGKYVALLFIMVQRASLVLNEAWHV